MQSVCWRSQHTLCVASMPPADPSAAKTQISRSLSEMLMWMSIDCFTHLHTNLLFDAKKHGCCVGGLEMRMGKTNNVGKKSKTYFFPQTLAKKHFLDETKRKQKHHHNHSIIRRGPSSPLLVTQKQ